MQAPVIADAKPATSSDEGAVLPADEAASPRQGRIQFCRRLKPTSMTGFSYTVYHHKLPRKRPYPLHQLSHIVYHVFPDVGKGASHVHWYVQVDSMQPHEC